MSVNASTARTMGLGLVLASWVCLDPLITNYLGIDFFSHLLSLTLASTLVIGLFAASRIQELWRERDRWSVMFLIIMGQFSGVAFGTIDILEMATITVVAFWLLQALVERERNIQVSPLMFVILGLTFLSLLTLIHRPPLSGLVALVEKFALFFLIVDLMRRSSVISTSARLLIWTGAFSAAVAIAQCVIYLAWGYLLTIGIPPDADPVSFLKPTPIGLMPRGTAFFPNPAGLNDYLLFSSSVTLFALVSSPTLKLRCVYSGALLLMVTAIVLTWSTMALICLGVIAFVFLCVHRPSLFIHYCVAVLVTLILSYEVGLLEGGYRMVKEFGGESGAIRGSLLELGMESIQRNPVIGVGIKNFENVSGNFYEEGYYLKGYPVHNAFLQMATELGIFGGLLFLSVVVFLFIRLLTVLGSTVQEEKWIFKGFLVGFLAVVAHMLTEPMAYSGTLWLILGLIEGAGITILREKRTS